MIENSVLRFTVSFLLINSRSSFFTSHISEKTEPLELLYVPPFLYQLMLILRQKKTVYLPYV
jgi:hypothetical protein